jgi:hypothetical protein
MFGVGDHYIPCTPTLTQYNPFQYARIPFFMASKCWYKSRVLSINLIERPCVRETRIPDLIHNLHRLNIIFTRRSSHDRLNRPRPYAILMLLCKFPIIPRPKLPHESALPT